MSNLLSVVIPSADPRFLAQTVNDLFDKAAGEIEVIVSADGYAPDLPERKGLTVIVHERLGMRGALNAARRYVTGDWVAKSDEHCMFSEGYDAQLKGDCDQDWVMVPRRYSLDAENWVVENNRKGPRDYHFLTSCVWSIREKDDYSINGYEWADRTRERLNKPEYDVDDTLSWQGSFYFMSRRHWEWLGPLEEKGWGSFASEPQVVGLKTQLSGGRLMTNKRCWMAHLHKGRRYGRGYRPNKAEIAAGHEFNAWYWLTDQWAERKHDIRWLVEKWLPIPTWPADTLERWDYYFPQDATLAELKAAALGKAAT